MAGDDALLDNLRVLYHGEYEIDREIGRGGMAAVFAAFDPGLQRRVAIKALLPAVAAERDMAERFLREARTVAALQHPHVVTVYGVRSNAAVQALAMQFVEGRSLDAALREQAPMPLPVGGLVLAQVAAGLQHAHDRGVVHRDVKPANVLLETDGRAVVSDFGIAQREGVARITDTGMVVGTWAYMSPEQRRGENVTAAADQYSLGVMAFEVLAGQLPFTGTPSEMLRAHLYEAPPSLRSVRADVPAHVDAAVQRMLAKRPSDRFGSLRELERIFQGLVPDEKATTMLIAGMAHLRGMTTQSIRHATVAVPAPTPGGTASVVAAGHGAPAPAIHSPVRTPQTVASRARGTLVTRRIVTMAVTSVLVGGTAGFWLWTELRRQAADRGASPERANTTPSNVSPATAPSAQPTPAAAKANEPARRSPEAAAGGRSIAGVTPRTAPAAGAPAVAAANGAVRAVPLAGVGAAASSVTLPKPETSPARAPAITPPAGDAPARPAANLADARRLGRAFVTLLNQRQWRDVEQMERHGGDPALRDELVRLVRMAPEFAAGFDRLPSSPVPAGDGAETEFAIDLQWRGGHRVMQVHAASVWRDGAWHLAGFGVADVP